jgi:hypothetical protein
VPEPDNQKYLSDLAQELTSPKQRSDQRLKSRYYDYREHQIPIMLNAPRMALLESRLDFRTRPNRPLNEMTPLPPINLIKARLPYQLIPSQLRQNHRPYNPINASTSNNPPPYHAMQIVRKRFIHRNAVCWGNERRDHEVDVAGEEEDCHREGCAEGRVPVVLRAVCVQPDEAEGDEGVYYCEGVGDYALGRGLLVVCFA